MKKIKYLLTITVLSFMLVVLSGCSILFVKDKKFTNAGLSITLTSQFYEKDHISFTSYYESDKMLVVVIKEKFSSLSMVGITKNSTVEDYLKIVISANKHNTSLKEDNDVPYFTYERSESGKDFKYFATAVKGSDSFYLVQFCVISDTYDKLKDDIVKYASSMEAE